MQTKPPPFESDTPGTTQAWLVKCELTFAKDSGMNFMRGVYSVVRKPFYITQDRVFLHRSDHESTEIDVVMEKRSDVVLIYENQNRIAHVAGISPGHLTTFPPVPGCFTHVDLWTDSNQFKHCRACNKIVE